MFPSTVITRYEGIRLTDPKKIEELYAREGHQYAFELNETTTIDGINGGIAKYINHSCDLNVIARKWLKRTRKPDLRSNSDTIMKEDQMCYHVRKSIVADVDELTIDYKMKDSKASGRVCHCETKNCKKTY